MKKISIKKISILILMFTLFNFSYGIFDHIDWGSRVVGVGFGYGSYIGESSGIFLNPASISGISGKEIVTMYALPLTGLSGIDMSYMMGNFGMNLAIGGALGVGVGIFDVNGVWRESIYIVGYGREIGKFLLGGSVKYMDYKVLLSADEYDNDPLLEKGGKGVISSDIGCIYRVSEKFNIGLVARDILEPEIGLESSEKLSMGYIISGSYKVISDNMDVVISGGSYMYGSESDFSVGVEAWFSNNRVGVRGSYLPYRYAIGGSYDLGKLRVDYTYVINSQLEGTAGSHYISVLLKL